MAHTTTSYEGTSNMYIHVNNLYTYEDALHIFNTTKRVAGTLSRKMLSYLHIHCKNSDRKYFSRKNIFLKTLEIYLPKNYNLNYLSNHISRFACESLEGLPYYAYITKKNDCICLQILICERRYIGKTKVFEEEKTDIYKKQTETGGWRFCKSTDNGAVLSKKAGDIKRSYTAFFSFKNRLFAGNKKAFESFVESLKEKWVNLLKPLGLVKSHIYIPGISSKRAMQRKNNKLNLYWLRNIKVYNRVKCQINDDLTILFKILHELKIEDIDDDIFKEAWYLANKYKKMFVANKTIYLQRCDWVLETFNDINQLWKKDYNAFIEELSKVYTV